MKRRYADGRDNKDILESDFRNFYISNDKFVGNVAVLKINKVNKKWCVDEEERCILDDNYTWVQMYPKDQNYCITAMYDEKNNIKEWYFDITKNNGIENGVPYEDDLYLDVVIVPDGRVHILDEDELLEALNQKEITKEEYDLAYNVKNHIIDKFAKNIEELKQFVTFIRINE